MSRIKQGALNLKQKGMLQGKTKKRSIQSSSRAQLKRTKALQPKMEKNGKEVKNEIAKSSEEIKKMQRLLLQAKETKVLAAKQYAQKTTKENLNQLETSRKKYKLLRDTLLEKKSKLKVIKEEERKIRELTKTIVPFKKVGTAIKKGVESKMKKLVVKSKLASSKKPKVLKTSKSSSSKTSPKKTAKK